MRTTVMAVVLLAGMGSCRCTPTGGDCKTVSIVGSDTTWIGSKGDTIWSTSDTVHKPANLGRICAMASDTVRKP